MAELNQRPWDARLALWLVSPLKNSWVAPNHLTTLRLVVGLAAAAAFVPGAYGRSIVAAILMALSNLLDHADGELARLSGKTSRFGHCYDLACDAAVTVLLFLAIGVGAGNRLGMLAGFPALGAVAGAAIAAIFYVRMRIEALAGKAGARQASLGGFETEDILYLVPVVAVCDALAPMVVMAAVGAPIYAIWSLIEYRQATRRAPFTAREDV